MSVDLNEPKQRRGWCVTVGLLLGVLTTFLGYGAGGCLMLSVILGSLWIIFGGRGNKVLRTFCYCLSLNLSFLIFGVGKISAPFSFESLLVIGALILIPTGIAMAIDALTYSRSKNQASKRRKHD